MNKEERQKLVENTMTGLELDEKDRSVKFMAVNGTKGTMSRSPYGINPRDLHNPHMDVARLNNTRGAKLMRNE